MKETCAPVSLKTMRAKIARQEVFVKMKNRSNIDCAAHNKKVLVTGYKAVLFLQLREWEQYLLEEKLNMYSTRVVSGLVLNLKKYLHENGIKSLVSLTLKELSCGRGNENTISKKPIHFESSAY